MAKPKSKHSASSLGKSTISKGASFRFELPHTTFQRQINVSYHLNTTLNNIIGLLTLKTCLVATQHESGFYLLTNANDSINKCFELKLPYQPSITFRISLVTPTVTKIRRISKTENLQMNRNINVHAAIHVPSVNSIPLTIWKSSLKLTET